MARYTCEICGLEIDPKSATALRYVEGWAKGFSKNLKVVELEHYRFQHNFCQPRTPEEPTLFQT